MESISSLIKKYVLDYYDSDCKLCKKEIAKLQKIRVGRIELRADYNSEGYLTHYHIKVIRYKKRGEK